MKTTTHKPFLDGKVKGFIQSMKNSPYPWWYTALWPWYFRFPSTFRWSSYKRVPSEQTFGKSHLDDVSLLMAGDIMVLNGDKTPQLSSQLVELINRCDLFVANCEAPVGSHKADKNKKYSFLFHMPIQFFTGIFEQTSLMYNQIVLTNSNNHSGDAGADSHYLSYDILSNLGVIVLGLNNDHAVKVKKVGSINIGFCGWTHWLNCKVFENLAAPVDYEHVSHLDIPNIKAKNSIDFMVGMPHWEYEFQHIPKKSTKKIGAKLIKNGFDLLLGSHPHVLQPIEEVDGKLCIYSLGNFCGLGVSWPVKIIPLVEVKIGLLSTGKKGIKGYKYHFFYQYHTNEEIILKPLSEINELLYKRVERRIKKVMAWG